MNTQLKRNNILIFVNRKKKLRKIYKLGTSNV